MSSATAATDAASDDGAGERARDETEGEDEVADGASVDVTRKPTRVASTAAGLAALVGVVAGAPAPAGLAFGAAGALVLGAALVLGHRTAADVGAVVLFFGVVAGGLEATPVAATIVGTIATVLAWDFAHTAIDIGEQLGREARTIRLEAVAIVSSLLVGLVTGTIGYAVYVAGAGSQPVAAVVLLLVAGLLVTIGLGSDRDRSGSRRGRSSRSRRR